LPRFARRGAGAVRCGTRPGVRAPSGAVLRRGAYRLRRRQGLLQLLRVLLRERGLDHGAAVALERVDRLVRCRLLDDHEERRGARWALVADLDLNLLVDRLLAEGAEGRPEPGTERQPGERDEEDEPEEEPPEASPHGAASRRGASVRRRDVVLAVHVAANRCD